MTQIGTTNRYYATFVIPAATNLGVNAVSKGLGVYLYYPGDPVANGTYDSWNAQLEPGNYPMPFTPPNLPDDFIRCQRYFLKGLFCSSIAYTASVTMNNMSLPVAMRATPEIYAASVGAGDIVYATNNGTFTQANLGNQLTNISLYSGNSVLYCTTSFDSTSWTSGAPTIGDAVFVNGSSFNIDAELQ